MKPGDTVAHYQVMSLLGSGGMGEVFRARDTRLGREVALKVLPESVSADPERNARFQREARLLASFQHPNVASIYGFEEASGRMVLVMELVEGEDLAERLARGPVPVDTALDIATQIARGLEDAHEKGIVHRDLKPANVKLTPDGGVKILDFGLARAFESDAPEGDPSESPTITGTMTQAGVILGTAAYMSPEQARGHTADRRADIWAFGVLAYEMLTGRRLFEGATISDTLASVLRADPDWEALPGGLDPAVRLALRRCLRRDPRERLQHIGDARILLDERIAAGTPPRRAKGSRIALGVLAALLVVSAAWNIRHWMAPGGTTPTAGSGSVQHLAASLAPRAPLARARVHLLGIGRPTLTISPDGANLVYVAEVDGQTRLYKKRFDAAYAEEIPGTEGAMHPVFSPSGDWVAFFARDRIRKVLFAGSEPVSLCEVANPNSLMWETDRSLLATVKEGKELIRVDTDSGNRELVVDLVRGGSLARLPREDAVLAQYEYSGGINPDSWSVVGIDLEEKTRHTIIDGGFSPRYVPTGHLVYVRGGNLMGVAFDPETMETRGQPVPVVSGLRVARRSPPSYDFSENGTLVYVSGPPQTLSDMVWVDRGGAVTRLPFEAEFFGDFQLSPDGRYVAATVGGDRNDIWVYDTQRGTRRRVTTEGDGQNPIWSPDGRRIAFRSRRDGESACYVRPVDGGRPAQRVEVDGRTGAPYAWLPGEQIVVYDGDDVFALDLENDRVIDVAATTAAEWGPHVSADGRWIAYTSDESGRYEVYVKPYPQLDRAWTISSAGGEEPVWARDGQSLFYRNGDTWLEVPVTADPDFTAGQPRVVVEGPYINVPGRSYDVSPDGSRFLLIRDVGNEEYSRHVEVVLNWFDELQRLIPTETE